LLFLCEERTGICSWQDEHCAYGDQLKGNSDNIDRTSSLFSYVKNPSRTSKDFKDVEESTDMSQIFSV
jgi:hypothetical protein